MSLLGVCVSLILPSLTVQTVKGYIRFGRMPKIAVEQVRAGLLCNMYSLQNAGRDFSIEN